MADIAATSGTDKRSVTLLSIFNTRSDSDGQKSIDSLKPIRESIVSITNQYLENGLDAILHNFLFSDNASATPSTSSIWQRLDRIRHEHNITASLNETAERNLDSYFELHLEGRKVDPILWWQKKALIMPHLL